MGFRGVWMLGLKNKEKYKKELLILGVHLSSAGYPNVKFRIEDLKRSYSRCREVNFPMWREVDIGGHERYRFLNLITRALCANTLVITALIFLRRNKVVYIPYPSTFICLAISLAPFLLKPKHLVIDAFISLYDTVVIDRNLINTDHIFARLLKAIEKKALGIADVVITDTDINSDYYASLFDIERSKFKSIPLATDEKHLPLVSRSKISEDVDVLFIGTLVPLHGIKTILESIALNKKNKNIKFTIVGDGQDRNSIKEYIKKHPGSIKWVEEWQNEEKIIEHISKADICLGIFGTGDKVQRVCPFKLYLYMSCGKAVITGDTRCMRDMFKGADVNALMFVPTDNPILLAEAIQDLSKDYKKRESLAWSAREFYKKKMANENSTEELLSQLKLNIE